jgi:thioredoxin reductase
MGLPLNWAPWNANNSFFETVNRITQMLYHEYLIIGAGPGGLQMGYFMEEAGHDYLILERTDGVASFYKHYPRHNTLLSLNKNHNLYPEPEYNLRHDWNSLLTYDYSHRFGEYSNELYPDRRDLVRYLEDFARKFELKIRYNTSVARIIRETGGDRNFILTTADGTEYQCRRLIMATGAVKPVIPDIEGIELAENYADYDTNPERFKNRRVVILGCGNSAFEAANDIAGHAAIVFIMIGNNLVHHAWNSHCSGDLRAYNNTILDMVQLKALHTVTGSTMTKLVKQDDGSYQVHSEEELPHWKTPGTAFGWFEVDHVIYATGFRYADPLLFTDDIAPRMCARSKYPELNSSWESSPDLFYIGAPMAARDKKTTSGLIHGFRYCVRSAFNIIQNRYHGVPFPSECFELNNEDDLQGLGTHLINRFSTTSALYQLFGLMSDVLVLEDGMAELFYELPVEYVLKDSEFASKKIIVLTLELGFEKFENGFKDTLNFIRLNDSQERTGCVSYLHPVFRLYQNGRFVRGSNTRSSTVVRFDPACDLIDGDLANIKPRNMLLNFLNSVVNVCDTHFPEDHFCVDPERHGFILWERDDPRTVNHGLQRCSLKPEDPQVTAIDLESFLSKNRCHSFKM